jgi:hypothetical protein
MASGETRFTMEKTIFGSLHSPVSMVFHAEEVVKVRSVRRVEVQKGLLLNYEPPLTAIP